MIQNLEIFQKMITIILTMDIGVVVNEQQEMVAEVK